MSAHLQTATTSSIQPPAAPKFTDVLAKAFNEFYLHAVNGEIIADDDKGTKMILLDSDTTNFVGTLLHRKPENSRGSQLELRSGRHDEPGQSLVIATWTLAYKDDGVRHLSFYTASTGIALGTSEAHFALEITQHIHDEELREIASRSSDQARG